MVSLAVSHLAACRVKWKATSLHIKPRLAQAVAAVTGANMGCNEPCLPLAIFRPSAGSLPSFVLSGRLKPDEPYMYRPMLGGPDPMSATAAAASGDGRGKRTADYLHICTNGLYLDAAHLCTPLRGRAWGRRDWALSDGEHAGAPRPTFEGTGRLRSRDVPTLFAGCCHTSAHLLNPCRC